MDETRSRRPLLRTFAVAGGALAILGACSTGGGGSSGSTTTVATTAFSTIPIQTTTSPGTAPGQGASGPSGDATGTPGGATYTAQAGPDFVGIAKKLGVPLQSLLDANGLTTDSLITPGQKLKVPSANATSSTTAKGGTSGGSTTTAKPGTSGGSSTTAGSTAPPTTTTLPG